MRLTMNNTINKESLDSTVSKKNLKNTKLKKSEVTTYFNAVKFRIKDDNLVNYLNYIHEIFLNEYELINQAGIQPNCFTKDELSHCFRGHFTKKIAELTNKNYLGWNLKNKAKYFRMFSLHLRQDFKSLDYRLKIIQILEKYNFNIKDSAVAAEIRNELVKLNLYPTKQEINNICRWHKNKNKAIGNVQECSHSQSYTNDNAIIESQFDKVIPLDFTLGQDKQTIFQPDAKEPVFHVRLNGNWVWLNFTEQINKLEYFKNKINDDKFLRFTKPKFVFDIEQNCWFVIVTIERSVTVGHNVNNVTVGNFVNESTQNNLDHRVSQLAGVDIGQVKPYSAVVLELDHECKLNTKICSGELTCKKETKVVNNKLNEVKFHLSNVYRKLNVYENIIKNNKNPEFTQQILKKQELLINEKRCLRRKRKELQKRKSYLVARDLIKQLNFFNVKKVNIERLNWVEHTGGNWDFSQQQDILMRKAIEHGIKINKVYAANTSKENPFTMKQKTLLGKPDPKTRKVKFKRKKYQIDRDILGAINVALRPTKKDETKLQLDFNMNKKILLRKNMISY
jgi:hypothetical protein